MINKQGQKVGPEEGKSPALPLRTTRCWRQAANACRIAGDPPLREQKRPSSKPSRRK